MVGPWFLDKMAGGRQDAKAWEARWSSVIWRSYLTQNIYNPRPPIFGNATGSRDIPSSPGPNLHTVVGRPPSTFWYHPVNVLTGVLDVARFAVNAVLSVYLQPLAGAVFNGHELVHTWKEIKWLMTYLQTDVFRRIFYDSVANSIER
jgi:hypothetical protein